MSTGPRRDCTRSRQAPYYQLWCAVCVGCRPISDLDGNRRM